MNTQEFINKSNIIHNYKYDYSKTKYINSNTKIIIICPKHGEFQQLAKNHYKGCGCSKCKNEKLRDIYRFSQEEVIINLRNVHGDIYDYSMIDYKNSKTKLHIICKIHGDFFQSYDNHVKGQGCPKCRYIKSSNKRRKKSNLDEIIFKFPNLDFSNFIYKSIHEKSEIKCKKCNTIFFNSIVSLKKRKNDCLYCNKKTKKTKYTVTTLLNKFNEIHNNFYIYPNLEIKPHLEKIEIICPNHGNFYMTINNHLRGQQCIYCFREKQKKMYLKDTEDFFNICKKIHKNKYDYSKSIYKGMFKKIKIICPIHGLFEQKAKSHYEGHGCRKCSESKGEKIIRKYLKDYNIIFKSQKTFNKCRNIKTKALLKFDFYLPHLNLCIEYDGEQHFKSIKYWGGEKGFKEQQIKDNIKNNFCKNNNINLLRIPYYEFNNIESILKNNIGIGTDLL